MGTGRKKFGGIFFHLLVKKSEKRPFLMIFWLKLAIFNGHLFTRPNVPDFTNITRGYPNTLAMTHHCPFVDAFDFRPLRLGPRCDSCT